MAALVEVALGETSRPLIHVLVSPPTPDGATVDALEPALAFAAALLAAATLEHVWVLAQAYQARQDGEAFLVPVFLVIPVDEGFRRYQSTLRTSRSVSFHEAEPLLKVTRELQRLPVIEAVRAKQRSQERYPDFGPTLACEQRAVLHTLLLPLILLDGYARVTCLRVEKRCHSRSA